MQIDNDVKLDYADVLVIPKISTLTSRAEVDITREFKLKWCDKNWWGVPVIAANMDTTGTFEMAQSLAIFRMATALHKHYSIEEYVEFFSKNIHISDYVFYSLGITEKDFTKFKSLKEQLGTITPRNICIDVANGYTEVFVDFIKKFREYYPEATIMAGNVVTGAMTEQIILAGADMVKVGIGPGSACTTRKIAGVGYPQLSAVIECADAAHGVKGLICADGGITVPGDLFKAFGAGADFVMMGGVFSGHDESGGELITKIEKTDEYEIKQMNNGNLIDAKPVFVKKQYKMFYGMSSDTAMEKYSGGVASYRASEGKTVLIPYKGPVENTVKEFLGGLRSGMTYIGAIKLKEVSKRTTFIRVNRQKNDIYGKD